MKYTKKAINFLIAVLLIFSIAATSLYAADLDSPDASAAYVNAEEQNKIEEESKNEEASDAEISIEESDEQLIPADETEETLRTENTETTVIEDSESDEIAVYDAQEAEADEINLVDAQEENTDDTDDGLIRVDGELYSGYYIAEDGLLYEISKGIKGDPKTGTVAVYSDQNCYDAVNKKFTVLKTTVYVEGEIWDGYYTDSSDIMFKVSKGARTKKSGTIMAPNSYYSYNKGKTVDITTDTVYVNGKKYSGYYTDSSDIMFKVSKGSRTKYTGTLSSGTKYYSYNSGKYITLSSSATYNSGKLAGSWVKKSGTWCYYDSSGTQKFSSNALYSAWSKIKSKSSSTSYYIVVSDSDKKVMIFKGSKGNWEPVKCYTCSTGASSTSTPKGNFSVDYKGYSFGTSSYTCYYYTNFRSGGYRFHSVLYYPGTFTVKDGRLGYNISHGCVRLNIDHAKWIYNNIKVKTPVYIY